MVGGTTHQHQQASQLAPPQPPSSSSAPVTTPEEDELLKRNTDCVYFLASPLTCKKGSECEYRHSDNARVNPRDCWYWLNGNCLNPKCAFRHPPLDGLLGAEVSTPMGPSVPAPHATPYGMPKQGVVCIFFQKGFCLKGHLCPFLHGPPNSVNNKATQPGSSNPVTEPPKMAYSGQKIMQQATVHKPVEFQSSQGKQAPTMQRPLPARNGGNGAVDKKVPLPSSMVVEEPPRYKPARVVPPPAMKETRGSKPDRSVYHAYQIPENDRIMNGKDADEYSPDPSPGFDVLVDNKHGDSEYYHEKDEFGRSTGHDYDMDQPTDYDIDTDVYHEQRDYDHYSERDDPYVWDERRGSSEKMLVGSAHLERRPHPRSDSPDHYNKSDLRHRISKQRRGSENGLRSIVSHDFTHENHAERVPRRDSHRHHHHQDQGALSSRLRGRIKIPVRSISPPNENNSRIEREIDRGWRHQSRYSPGRPQSLNQSRLRDRMMGRVTDDHNIDVKDYKGSRGPRDLMYGNETEFAGPKRLSELKSGKSNEGRGQQLSDVQVLGKRKNPRIESRQSEDDLSFEGPKPLSEILKRKRGVDSHVTSVNNDAKQNYKKDAEVIPEITVSTNKEEHESVLADLEPEKQMASSNIKKDHSVDGKSSFNHDENEGDLIDEDALLDQELEAYDHREGDYDYEQIDGEEDYNLDEGEYVEEEDDGDAYRKKDNVVYE